MKIVLLGDASSSGHFGCKLVTQAILENLEKRGHEVIRVVPWDRHWRYYEEDLKKCDLVVVNGEGSIHHGHHMEMLEVASEYPSVLINCVYQNVPENEHIKRFLYVSVRESRSAKEMEKHGVTPMVVPDVIFYHDIPKPTTTKDLCIVDSVTNEKKLHPSIDLHAHDPDFVQKMGEYSRVVTGRFHALCLAIMWGMEFKAYSSNTHKIIGMLEDIGFPSAYYESMEEAIKSSNMAWYIFHKQRLFDLRKKIEQMFDFISNISPTKTHIHINTPDKILLRNISLANKRKLPELTPVASFSGMAAIVGGGPSLKKTVSMLKKFPGVIVSTNNTHDYLIERGITPQYYIMMDPKRDNYKYVQNSRKDIYYLISSKCNPSVFKTLKKRKVVLWHEMLNIGEPEDSLRICGGSTVGLRAINVMYTLGYRDFHLFGMDSCYEGEQHHAYKQEANDKDTAVTVICGGKTFKCAPWMVHQANDFKQLLTDLGSLFTVSVHGDGLLSQIIDEANRIYQSTLEKHNASTS